MSTLLTHTLAISPEEFVISQSLYAVAFVTMRYAVDIYI